MKHLLTHCLVILCADKAPKKGGNLAKAAPPKGNLSKGAPSKSNVSKKPDGPHKATAGNSVTSAKAKKSVAPVKAKPAAEKSQQYDPSARLERGPHAASHAAEAEGEDRNPGEAADAADFLSLGEGALPARAPATKRTHEAGEDQEIGTPKAKKQRRAPVQPSSGTSSGDNAAARAESVPAPASPEVGTVHNPLTFYRSKLLKKLLRMNKSLCSRSVMLVPEPVHRPPLLLGDCTWGLAGLPPRTGILA